jgi:hypothetical protein
MGSVKKVSLNDLLNDTAVSTETTDENLKKWDDQVGGKVVDSWTEGSTKYVLVEFEKSPGRYYLYLG